MDKNTMVVKKHIIGMTVSMFLLLYLLLLLFPNTEYTVGWWIAFICIVGAISCAITDICYVYAKYLIHKTTSEE